MQQQRHDEIAGTDFMTNGSKRSIENRIVCRLFIVSGVFFRDHAEYLDKIRFIREKRPDPFTSVRRLLARCHDSLRLGFRMGR